MKIEYKGIIKTGEYGKYIQLYNNPHKFFISVREHKDALTYKIDGYAWLKGNLTLTNKGNLIIFANKIDVINKIGESNQILVTGKLYKNKYGRYIIVRREINGNWSSYFIPVVGGGDNTIPNKSEVNIYGTLFVDLSGKIHIMAEEIVCI